MAEYAKVIVDISQEKLDKTFEYRIPPYLTQRIAVGMQVYIPFGSRRITGYVVELSDEAEYDEDKLKNIAGIVTDSVPIESHLIALAGWMREHYGGTMNQALKMVLPIKEKKKAVEHKRVRLALHPVEAKNQLGAYERRHSTARAKLLRALLEEEELDWDLVTHKLGVSGSVIRAMEESGVVKVIRETQYRNPVSHLTSRGYGLTLNDEQQEAVDAVWSDYEKGIRSTYLIKGVTGSGKTEVYMELIAKMQKAGRQAIVLIPEIALTYQTVMRFYRCFGDRVSIMNSRLSAGERYDQMMRAKRGEVDVMIGPRSALFTPFPDLGLIVIDEEHEPTYKSEQVPRYHAREVAVHRAEVEDASVVLGSATPSMEAMYRARLGEYQLYEMKNRSHMQQMATVYTVDMRKELKNGNRSILSEKLQELIEDRLNAKEQIMLFLNRRGYSGFISCRECGHVVKCPHCNVSLSVHKGGKMVCHYCGYEQPKVTKCPECGSRYIGEFRAGTQQIEDMVKARFPQARVLRMDMDTTKKKDSHEQILSAFANEEADILVGTQMIVKGHDFPKVTLVGALAADMSLYTDDYRSGERTFQLLTQAAGRAGRGDRPGEVVIQTYDPEHYAIEASAAQDYEAFYEKEIRYRSLMGYPPVENLMAVLAACEDEALLEKACKYLKEYILRIKGQAQLNVIGPASPGVDKIKDIYRRVVYVKAPEYRTLVVLKDRMEQYIEINSGFQKMRIQFDFNPMNL